MTNKITSLPYFESRMSVPQHPSNFVMDGAVWTGSGTKASLKRKPESPTAEINVDSNKLNCPT